MLAFILTNLPILLCLVIGMALLIVEVFMPGFGVAGISGIALLLVGVFLVWQAAGPLAALGVLLILVALLAIALSIALRSTSSGLLSKTPLVLHEQSDSSAPLASNADLAVLLGREGRTITPLRPAGIADIDGVRMNVVSDGGYIPQGILVSITEVEGTRIVVKAAQS
jgi:membrane-bound ClpP family serine protease